MKNFIVLVLLLASVYIYAQAPQSFNYQVVVRDNAGQTIPNQNVSFRIHIQQSTAFTDVYVETHNLSTNQFGLANLAIGSGNIISGDFSAIDWGADVSYIQIDLDTTGRLKLFSYGGITTFIGALCIIC